MGLVDDPGCPNCDDTDEEDVAHFLLYCDGYDDARATLRQNFPAGLPFTLRNILAPPNSLPATQRLIVVSELNKFIVDSGRWNIVA